MNQFSLLDPDFLEERKKKLFESQIQKISEIKIEDQKITADKKSKSRAIVLDLNGVLIQKEFDPKRKLFEENKNNEEVFHVNNFYIKPRPFLVTFLKSCNENFHLIIWSSAKKHNIEKIVKSLPAFKGIEKDILSQDDCIIDETVKGEFPLFMKPLSLITEKFGYEREKIIILDDSKDKILPEDRENLMLIPSFSGNFDDNVLMNVFSLIEKWALDGKFPQFCPEEKNENS